MGKAVGPMTKNFTLCFLVLSNKVLNPWLLNLPVIASDLRCNIINRPLVVRDFKYVNSRPL